MFIYQERQNNTQTYTHNTICVQRFVATARTNQKVTTEISAEVETETLAYVDDIVGIGDRENVEDVGKNMEEMETKKKYTFATTAMEKVNT